MARRQTFRWKPAALAVMVAPASGGPSTGTALNGVPIVNIVAPNGAGLSHNRYQQFNVDSRGLILNNATQDGVSQLGGAIQANASLGGTSARIILNEVVAPNRSMLNGFIEVNGQRADVVLANPSGITCNGCGFINTPRATLTTGTPNIDGGGNLTGFSIRGGDIAITGAGLDATQQDAFNILARAVTVTGQINAKDLLVVGGAHDFSYDNRAVTAAGSGPLPTIGIDSSLLGGMYADRIRLVVTENGVGVRLLGDVGASAGDVMLTSAGKIELLGKLTAASSTPGAGNVSIQYTGAAAADAISLGSGAVVVAQNDLTVDGGAGGGTFTGGTIGANRNATFTLASLDDSGSASDLRFAGGLLALNSAGVASVNGPNWNGSGGLTVNAASLSVGAGGAGFFAASGGNPSGAVSIHTTGNLSLGSGVVSATAASLQTDSGTLSIGSGGAVEASGAVDLSVGNGFTNAGTISAGTDVTFSTLKTSGALTLQNSATGRIEAGGAVNADFSGPTVALNTESGSTLIGDTLAINVASVDNAGKMQGTHGSTIIVNSFTNEASGLAVLSAAAGSNGTLTTNSLTNLGSARSGGVATAGITSNGGMTIDVANPFTNAGNLVAAQDLTLRSSSISNGSLIQAGGTLALRGAGDSSNLGLTNNAGATIVGNQLLINANTVSNAGAMEGVAGSTISVADDFANQAGGIVTLARNSNASGSITAANLITNAGTIQSFGGMTLAATAANNEWALTNTGTLAAAGNMTLQLAGGTISLRNENMIAAGGVLQVNVSGSGTIDNGLTGSVMRGGTVNIAAPNAVLFNGGKLYSTGSMTSNTSWVLNRGTGAIFAEQNLSLTTGIGDIQNAAGGVILSGGTMALTSSFGNILNDMEYQAGGDAVGIIRSGGALTLSAPNGGLTNHGWIDSNSGNVTITANRVVNESFAPAAGTSTGVVTLIAGTLGNVGFDNMYAGTVFPKINLHDQVAQTLTLNSLFTMFDDEACFGSCQLGGGNAQAYFLWTNDGNAPRQPGGTWLYRDFKAIAHSGAQYSRAPVQARIVANGGSMTVNAPVELIGAEMRARDNLAITGAVDLTPIFLSDQTVWNVDGQDRWKCVTASCVGSATLAPVNAHNISASGRNVSRDFRDYQYDGQYRIDGLNGSGNYTLTPLDPAHPTGSMVTMAAFLGTSNGQRSSTSGTSNPTGLTINGSVTTHNPVDLINGLSALSISPIAPTTPLVANAGPGGTTSGAQPASALIAAGVNVSLPTNPNGLFIVNPNPNVKYLIELNPLYTTLENVLFGSDYLVNKLGLNPDGVMQRLGDKTYEAELIKQQVARQTGRSLLAGASTNDEQLQRLYDNAAWESKDLGLSFGVALTANQLNSLKQDMVWMVETVVAGHHVLAPVVYLSDATRASVKGGTQIVADNLAVTGASFINNGGTVDVTRSLSVRTTGDIVNTAGTISGGSVSLVSDTGNVRNDSVVSRLGNSDNYHDVIARGAIVSTGTLNIEATKGSVTNTGGQIKSGGDATVRAGQNISFEAVTLESKSTVEKSRTAGMFGTQKETTKITTTTQQAVGGDLSSGGNLTLNAGRDVNVIGSQAKARGDLTVDAAKVNVLNTTTTNTTVTEKSKSGLGVSISSGGTIGMGYGTSSSTTTQTDVNVVAGGLTSGGNTRITGRDSVTVRGSDVKSGGDLAVNTRNLTTQAAQQTTTVDRTSTSTNAGMYAGGDGNSASAGWDGSRTDGTSHDMSSTARTSTLSSGGNMTLGNAAGNGTISHQGTQIDVGGNFSQSAATINFTAAENRRESTSSSTTTGGKTGINANYNAQQGYEQAKGGGVPDAAAPSVTGSVGGQRDESNTSSSSTTAVAGSIRAGGNVTSTSSGKTTLEGTNIQSGGNTSIAAGSLEYKAATSTRQSSNDSMTTGGSAYIGEDATGSVVGGASGNYGTSNASGSGTSQRAGSIVSRGNTTITTTGDATFQGTNLDTRGNTTISAGGKVDYQAAVDTASSSNSSMNAGGGFDASKSGKGGDSSKSGQIQGSYDNSSDSTNIRVERAGSIVSGGNVTISAGRTSDLSMTGTDIAAGGNVALSAGRNVDLKAAESTMSTSSSSMSAGGSAGKESPGKDSKDKGGVSGSGNFGMDGSGSQASSQQGALITGRNVSVQAGTDLSMTGTVIGAQDTAKLNAGGKLDMQSAQDRSSSSSSNVSVGVGGSKGDGAGGHAGGAGGSASSENVVNRNAIVSGNNVQVTTGGDATLRGANIAGNSVSTTVGGNLSIESRADVNRASNNQAGGYIGGSTIDTHDISTNSIISQRGEIAKTGAGFNYQNSNTDSTQVTMQSGIVGQQSNTVNVTGNTNLTGARIGSDAGGAVNVTTSRLTQSAVEQSTSQSGYSIGGSAQIGNWQAPSTKTTGGSTSSTLQSSVQGPVTQTAPGAAPVTSAPASVPLAEGQTPVQPTIKLAQLGAVLNQPAVQTALKLNKGMKAAVEQYGSSDSVPVDTVRRILGDAGVAIPAGSTDRAVMVLLNNTLESGYAAATTQLGATNIPASQAGGILKAIIP